MYEDLSRAIARAYEAMQPFRSTYKMLVKEYAGATYAHADPGAEVCAINLLQQMIEAYVVLLASNRPRVLVTPRNSTLKPFASIFQGCLNRYMEDIRFERVLREVVIDAVLQMGVAKCQVSDGSPYHMSEQLPIDPGRPVVKAVHLDDLVLDVRARDWDSMRFCGDRYSVPLSRLKQYELGREAMEMVERAVVTNRLSENDRLSPVTDVLGDDYEPVVDLADVWVPAEGKVLTYVLSPNQFRPLGEPISEVEWYGDPNGPYHRLGFLDVPGSPISASIAAQVVPLANLANMCLRVHARQMAEMKQLIVYSPASEETAQLARVAGNGEWIKATDPREIVPIEISSVSTVPVQSAQLAIDLFDRMAGNLRLLLGLGAHTETLGQEQMLMQSTSRRISYMYVQTREFASRLVRSLAYLVWRDVALRVPVEVEVDPNVGLVAYAEWAPGVREGKFYDYDIEVDVYSASYKGPGERAALMNQLVLGVLSNLAPLLATQGGAIHLKRLVEMYAELVNEPRLKDVVRFHSGPQAQVYSASAGAGAVGGVSGAPVSRGVVSEEGAGGLNVQPTFEEAQFS